MEQIESLEQYFTLVRRSQPTVMIFSAGWCPDCTYLDRFIDEVEAAHPAYSFFKVNRDEYGELCETLDILGIPSLLVYQNGEIAGRFVSKLRKTREEVESFLSEVGERLSPVS